MQAKSRDLDCLQRPDVAGDTSGPLAFVLTDSCTKLAPVKLSHAT